MISPQSQGFQNIEREEFKQLTTDKLWYAIITIINHFHLDFSAMKMFSLFILIFELLTL